MYLKKRIVKGTLYWSIAKSYRENGKVKQKVIESLGNTTRALEICKSKYMDYYLKILNYQEESNIQAINIIGKKEKLTLNQSEIFIIVKSLNEFVIDIEKMKDRNYIDRFIKKNKIQDINKLKEILKKKEIQISIAQMRILCEAIWNLRIHNASNNKYIEIFNKIESYSYYKFEQQLEKCRRKRTYTNVGEDAMSLLTQRYKNINRQ